jgi:hypothetical protein
VDSEHKHNDIGSSHSRLAANLRTRNVSRARSSGRTMQFPVVTCSISVALAVDSSGSTLRQPNDPWLLNNWH